MIKVGIIGGAGYTAGELIRLLLNHPDAEITFVNSTSNAVKRPNGIKRLYTIFIILRKLYNRNIYRYGRSTS